MLRWFLALSLVLFVVSAFTLPASAQSQTELRRSQPRFLINGRVLDATGAPIAGARVTATPQHGPTASAVSDERGAFALSLVRGRYTIAVHADGFVDIAEMVEAPASGADSREFIMSVAGVRETVNVSAPSSVYHVSTITTATKTATSLRDVPQSVTVITKELIRDQQMLSVADVVRYVPGVIAHQGENNRDQVIIRGNNSSADFFLDGVRDDVQYYRDLYNVERVEALKGPNAMIFGRGGGGGVINRVSKEPRLAPIRELTLFGGSFGNKRFTADVDEPLSDRLAFRVNALYENSDSFRQFVNTERYGINPTVAITVMPQTTVTIGYEHLHDNRVADRGIPSYLGRPADTDVSSYFGNPADSHVSAGVDVASATLEHRAGVVNIRNRTLIGNYQRTYQNFVPGAVTADKAQVALSAYNNSTTRLNVINQTDLTYATAAGHVRHTLLAGAEVGRQLTDNFRNTGFFNNTATSMLVPYATPTVTTPVTFRQNATDADNHLQTALAAVYAQDQIEFSRFVQVLAGLRLDSFDLQYHNNRNGDDLGRIDHLVSPRAGLVIKPMTPLSLYAGYSVSHLPSSGDQFSSLTTITQQMKPEKFANYEIGAKWDVEPNLSLTAAVYRLNRTNTRATDPNDPTRIVQTGSQRTNGFEVGINGRVAPRWQIAGGFAHQDAFVTSATTAARAGARVAQVPEYTLSLWNALQVHPRVGVAVGVVSRTDMYAAIDNTVTLPGYTDIDTAVYVSLSPRLRLQANVENLFDRVYYVNADNNTNISPGSPRAIRIGLIARF